MGITTSTVSLHKQRLADKENNIYGSSIKSPKAPSRRLRVSFTKDKVDMSKPAVTTSKATNHYSKPPTINGHHSQTKSNSLPASSTKVYYNGTVPLREKYLHDTPSSNISNNNHTKTPDYNRYRASRYDDRERPVPAPRASTSNLSSSSSRRSRARSVSPGRHRIVIQRTLSRNDLEQLKSAIRTAKRSSSTSERK